MDIWQKGILGRWGSQGEDPRDFFQTDCRLPERGEFEFLPSLVPCSAQGGRGSLKCLLQKGTFNLLVWKSRVASMEGFVVNLWSLTLTPMGNRSWTQTLCFFKFPAPQIPHLTPPASHLCLSLHPSQAAHTPHVAIL